MRQPYFLGPLENWLYNLFYRGYPFHISVEGDEYNGCDADCLAMYSSVVGIGPGIKAHASVL